MANKSKKNDSSLLDDWDDYMSAKKSKLQEQFETEAKNTDVKKNIFKGISIFVNGYTVPTADELRFLMMEYGGIYHHYYTNGKTSFMIASNLPSVKVKQFKTSNIKVIKPAWVSDSIEAGKMLDYKPYLLLSDFLENGKRISFEKNLQSSSTFNNFQSTNSSESILAVSILSPVKGNGLTANQNIQTKSNKLPKTANDENFLEEFYNNSRLHHISTQGATFKQYINDVRSKGIKEFLGKERLLKWKMENPNSKVNSLLETDYCIMHIDMDCFFVSVGLKKYPHLRSCPIVVTHARGNKIRNSNAENRKAEFSLYEKRNKEKCESNSDERELWFANIGGTDSMAEVASCSYEARKLGIKNGMLLGQAFKLCPNLKTIPYDFEGYQEVSYALYSHMISYTLDIEAVSCDEMFVDCTALLSYANIDILDFATILRKEIKEITGCTCSTGFGPNRLLARLATKKAKPDGQFAVLPHETKEFIQHFNVSDLPGIGHSITLKLGNMGVKTCKDLQNFPVARLQQEFGPKFGLTLHKNSCGEDNRPLNFSHQRKSVSAEINYGIRFNNSLDAEKFIKTLCTEVESRLNAIGSRGKSITLKLMLRAKEAPTETAKFLGHGVCDYITKTISLMEPTSDTIIIYREVMKIIQNMKIKPEDFRGIGIQMSRLEDKKNASGTSGKIDKFVIKNKTFTTSNGNQTDNSMEKSNVSTYSANSPVEKIGNFKTFNESEYDVSLSQVDPNYLEALPVDIRKEIISGTSKRKRIESSKNKSFLLDENPSSCCFILRENGLPKLNTRIPSMEIVKAIEAWISTEKVPQNCDIKMLLDYLQELISNQEYEYVNFIIDSFQRTLSSNNNQTMWKTTSQKLNVMLMKCIRSNC